MATLRATGALLQAVPACRSVSGCSDVAPSASSCSPFLPPAPFWGSKHSVARRQREVLGRPQAGRGQVMMGIRAVESYDSSFELESDNKSILVQLLSSATFCGQVAKQPGVPLGGTYEFSELLFQPVPWSPVTKHGMPQEYEKYLHDKDNYVIVNVPPNYMFQAKIFKPSRLCAIFRKTGVVEST
eukprot:TRINITY_DN1874_c0_g1_i2.p1 TRINITY_DN1874_c0_g1~~TRINITY_DN1874_c0_g1_i2.p1  ORF type:complete len:196 (-),score=32.92 TRINITY_DN1874_c0_g1_i2:594-1148(-)